MNVAYDVLIKCCYFDADLWFKMAASWVLSLTLDPIGNSYKNLLLENR